MFIVLDSIFRFPVLFPIFNMSPIAYLPRQFPFETKDGEEQCVFSESQSAINLAGSSLFSTSKVIVTEKGISASGNWIFYSKTGRKFNCSVASLDGYLVWYLANSQQKRFLTLFNFCWPEVIKHLPDLVWHCWLCKLKIDWKTWPRISSLFTDIYTDIQTQKCEGKGTF